tara:strand:+ start:5909 stop:8791 length:2883 start_codon:yes stop_codon:yes gene_type:complete
MLSKKDFFSFVLPTNGSYCLFTLKDVGQPEKVTKQIFVDTKEELVLKTDELIKDKWDIYVAVATFNGDGRRTKEKAKAIKCFFVDIDCGEKKPYKTQEEGTLALKKFCKKTNLCKPSLIINSGNGLHVYWVLENEIETSKWVGIAESLKSSCISEGFLVDNAVTANAAQILRVPETLNFKNNNDPKPVEVLLHGAKLNLSSMQDCLNTDISIFEELKNRDFSKQINPTSLTLQKNYKNIFKTIYKKSMQGVGCAQIKYAYENQETLAEPLWRAMLSIAERCVDKETAIKKMSQKYPKYNMEEALNKASLTKGPYTCAWYKKENSKICEGCKLKITSPIIIGKEVIQASEEDNVIDVIENGTENKKTYNIPEYPFPFYRGKVGGIYRRADVPKNSDEVVRDELIYPYDFYVVKRIHDPEDGESILLRLHLPKDGVREFIIPLSSTLAKDKFLSSISFHGITVLGKKQDHLMQYINRSVEKLQSEKKAEIARRQFGWTEDDGVFVYGDKEIKVGAKEPMYSPPTTATLILVPMFHEKGDFHTWKDIINAYAHEDRIGKAFAFFMGFGGPLMKFVGDGMLDGLLFNLFSPGSGVGKSSVLHLMNSIYGNPKALILKSSDTHNSRMQRLGTMQNLTPTIDEITNLDPRLMSDLVYDITSGRGKNRMDARVNRERLNKTTWSIPVVSTSNTRIRDALLSIKAFPDAELMRVLEDKLPVDKFDDPTWSKAHFGRVSKHYGHAIKPYIEYCVNNLPDVIARLNEINEKMDKAAEIKNTERFWSAGTAVALTGGIIAKELGLHDIPIQPVFDYAVSLVKSSRKSNKDSLTEYGEILGAFLNSHPLGITVVNVKKDKRTGLDMGAIKEPRTSCVARIEKDENRLYVSKSMYQQYCSKNFISFEDSLLDYKKNGSYRGIKKKRMLAGTSIASASNSVRCLEFDTKKLDSFDLEVFTDDKDNGSSSEDILD